MAWRESVALLNSRLDALCITNLYGDELVIEDAFSMLVKQTEKIKANQHKIFLIGNGASSSMASHVSADLAKNVGVHTQVFTDLSLITAIANDLSYEDVFSEPIKYRMQADDLLVAISSSGRSPNIIKGVKQALFNQAFVVTLSAMSEENPLRQLGHLNFYIPAQTYGMAETSHNAVLHHWIDRMTGDA